MKIGFDAKRAFHNVTGLGNYSRSVIESISEIRKNDELYLMTPKINHNNFFVKNKNIHIITPGRFTNKSYWRFIGINRKIKKLKLDVYHGLSNEIPYGINTKSIVTIHDLLFLKYPNFYNYVDRKIYHIKSQLACENANYIIATSKQTKADIINFFNINENKIKIIYQSCHQAFIMHSENFILNKEIKTHLINPFILYVGSIEERKNLLFLLKALQHTKKEIRLICVGKKGKYFNKINSFISKNKLTNRVVFLNIQDVNTLAILYRKSRGLVYPSINEGFGIPIVEGMYSKIPVITSNQPIFKEVGGQNSYYFETGNLDSLIENINEIWTDSPNKTKRIEANFKYVQKFNAKTQATQIIDLYKNLI